MKRRPALQELPLTQLAVQGAAWGSWTVGNPAGPDERGFFTPSPMPLDFVAEDFSSRDSLGSRPGKPLAKRSPGAKLARALMLTLPQSHGSHAADPFFDPFLAGITEQAAVDDFSLLLSRSVSTEDETARYLEQIQRQRADGVVLVRTSPHDPRIKLLRAAGIPFVVYGRTLDGSDFPHVDIDNEGGMAKMVEHLVKLGHTRIAGIVEPASLTKSLQRRYGLQAALQERGLLVSELIVEGSYTKESGYRAAQRLVALKRRPTAIVCGDDLMALGACTAASQAGLTVGRDISIGGFDDVFGNNISPSLTTVHNPAYEIGQMLCEMLVEIVHGRAPAIKQAVLDPDLIVGQSTGPAPR